MVFPFIRMKINLFPDYNPAFSLPSCFPTWCHVSNPETQSCLDCKLPEDGGCVSFLFGFSEPRTVLAQWIDVPLSSGFLFTQNTWHLLESAPTCSLQEDTHACCLQLTTHSLAKWISRTVAISLPLTLVRNPKGIVPEPQDLPCSMCSPLSTMTGGMWL